MNNFANTIRGQKFFDADIPKIAKALETIANGVATPKSLYAYVIYSEQHNIGDDTITDMECYREVQSVANKGHKLLDELEGLGFFNADRHNIADFFADIANGNETSICCYREGIEDVDSPKYFSITVKVFEI